MNPLDAYQGNADAAGGAAGLTFAQKVLSDLMRRLASIDGSLVRLVELAQGPRDDPLAAGSVPFGGSVGVTAASCTVSPPIGFGPGVILAAAPHRRGLSVQNLSASGGPNLTLGIGLTSPTAGVGITLLPGATWDGRISNAVWPGTVSVIASGAACLFAGVAVNGRSERRNQHGRITNHPL
jgi:hypothetical protein